MRRLSTRRRRPATAWSRRAQSQMARSIGSGSLEKVSAPRQPHLGPGAALALDALEHLIDADPLPGVEHLIEQCVPVGEMPAEAAFGDAERLRQDLDPDGVRAAGRQGPQALLDPPAAGGPGDGGHGLPLSRLGVDYIAGGASLHVY